MTKYALKDTVTGLYYINTGAYGPDPLALGALEDVRLVKSVGAATAGRSSRCEYFSSVRGKPNPEGMLPQPPETLQFIEDRAHLDHYGIEHCNIEVDEMIREI